MEPRAPGWARCLDCGAYNRPEASRCYLCRHPIGPDAKRVPPSPEDVEPSAFFAAQRSFSNRYHRNDDVVTEPSAFFAAQRSFSLGSLLLVIALMAVCLGVGRESSALGIALTIASAPALIRTTLLAGQAKARGRPMPALVKVLIFLGSLAAVVLVFLSALIAFAATCFPIGSAGRNPGAGYQGYDSLIIDVAIVVGVVSAVAAAVFTYWLIRRLRRLIRRLRDRGT
jgi:hypothetical protein